MTASELKKSLSSEDVFRMADLLVEMWDNGARPMLWTSQTQDFIERIRIGLHKATH
jgi:hypothetical protein